MGSKSPQGPGYLARYPGYPRYHGYKTRVPYLVSLFWREKSRDCPHAVGEKKGTLKGGKGSSNGLSCSALRHALFEKQALFYSTFVVRTPVASFSKKTDVKGRAAGHMLRSTRACVERRELVACVWLAWVSVFCLLACLLIRLSVCRLPSGKPLDI